MPERIKDGIGKGYYAQVSSDNRLRVDGVQSTKEHYTNLKFQDAYNLIFSLTPNAGSVFLYVKNLSDKLIICEGVNLWATSDEKITVSLSGIGTPSGGSNITPVNLTSGSGNAADGVFQSGVNITGITNQIESFPYRVSGGGDSRFINFDADIVIPKSQTLIMSVTNGSIAIEGFLVFWHENI